MTKDIRVKLLNARLPAKFGVGNGVAYLTTEELDYIINLISEKEREHNESHAA